MVTPAPKPAAIVGHNLRDVIVRQSLCAADAGESAVLKPADSRTPVTDPHTPVLPRIKGADRKKSIFSWRSHVGHRIAIDPDQRAFIGSNPHVAGSIFGHRPGDPDIARQRQSAHLSVSETLHNIGPLFAQVNVSVLGC